MADLPRAVRGLAANRSWTVAAATSLGLGIACVPLALSVVDVLVRRPIPGVRPEGLFRIEGVTPGEDARVVSHPEWMALRNGLEGVGVVAAERVNTVTVNMEGLAVTVGAALVTPGYFPLLDVDLVVGTGLDTPVGPSSGQSVVIAEGFWRSRMGADPSALGSTIGVNGMPLTVVGVSDGRFSGGFPGFRVQLWFPVAAAEQVFPRDGPTGEMGNRFLNVLGRLEPGAALESLTPRLEAVAARFADEPDYPAGRTFIASTAVGVHPALAPVAARVATVLLAVALPVFVVACANVANLSLSRGIARVPELAIRMALGAGRFAMARQFLIESVLLALVGTGLALVATTVVTRSLSALSLPVGAPLGLSLPVDGRTVALGGAAGFLAAALSGLLPTLRTLSRARRASLAQHFASCDAPAGATIRSALVGVQIGAACMLLIGASLLLRSVRNLSTLDAGFQRDRIVTVSANPEALDETDGRRFWNDLLDATRSTPGVLSADLGLFVHLGDRSDRVRVWADGAPSEEEARLVHYSLVGPQYVDVLGIELVAGRSFDVEDRDGAVAVVNQAFADRLWPRRDPLGRAFRLSLRGEAVAARVVGVAETVKVRRLNEPPTPFIYLPLDGWYRSDMVIHARSGLPPAELAEALGRRLPPLGGMVPLEIRAMADHATMGVVVARILEKVLIACGAVALLIAATGVFGVVAYATAQRSREMAIRRTLGASQGRVRRLVTLQALRPVVYGIVAGVTLFLPVGGALSAMLYGVSPWDPSSVLGAAWVLVVVAALAAWIPAGAALRMEPADLLRSDGWGKAPRPWPPGPPASRAEESGATVP